MEKECSCCHGKLFIDNFHKSKKGKFGVAAICKKCVNEKQKTYHQKNKDKRNKQSAEWRLAHKDRMKELQSKWKEANPEQYKFLWEKHNKENRIKVLQKVAKGDIIACSRCGCDRIEFLEVNHINGGGNQETKNNHSKFYSDILKDLRQTDDLEILCKLCNNLHYVEMKFGKLPFRIIWKKNESIISK